jgi:hypothetical protein
MSTAEQVHALQPDRNGSSRDDSNDNWIARALTGVADGKRHDTSIELAGYFKSREIPLDITLLLLRDWNTHNQPPWSEAELSEKLDDSVTRLYRSSREATVIPMSKVQAKSVNFLWEGRFPRGKLVGIEGDPGLGKTLLSIDFASHLSTGTTWPDGSPCPKGRTMIVTYEDDIADTIKPRLEAAGADMDSVFVLTQIPDAKGTGWHAASFPSDVPTIEAECKRHAIDFLIIDPFSASLDDKVDSWSDQKLRKAMAPLSAMANRLGLTIILIRHLNKKAGLPAIYRGGGSIAAIAACRAGYVVAPMPDDPLTMVMAVQKYNLGRKPTSMAFQISERNVTIEGKTVPIGAVDWIDCDVPYTAKELLNPKPKPTKKDIAKDILQNLFTAEMEKPSAEVYALGAKSELSEDTILRAAKELGFTNRKAWEGKKGNKKQVGYMKAPTDFGKSDPFSPLKMSDD